MCSNHGQIVDILMQDGLLPAHKISKPAGMHSSHWQVSQVLHGFPRASTLRSSTQQQPTPESTNLRRRIVVISDGELWKRKRRSSPTAASHTIVSQVARFVQVCDHGQVTGVLVSSGGGQARCSQATECARVRECERRGRALARRLLS